MKMISIILIIAIMICIIAMPMVVGQTIRIYPCDDVFVRDGSSSGTNFQNPSWKQNLRTGYEESFGTDKSYLKFDLSELQDKEILSSEFTIFVVSNHDNPVLNLFYVSDNSWQEETLTWNNAPSNNNLVGSKSITSGGAPGRINFNVEQYVDGDFLSVSLIENGNSGFTNFYSKDLDTGTPGDEENWPYLEVEYENQEECPSTDYSNVCCTLTSLEMMNFINKFNNFETNYSPIEMMNFINKFNNFEPLC
jgi:hypothetical protein